MYKKIFMGIAAVAALTLVSCSSDDLNSLSDNSSKNEAISFDGYLGRSAVAVNGSRGSVLDLPALKGENGGFGVFGNYKNADDLEFGSNWFDNVKVTYSNTDTKWTYSPVQYWLPQGHIDFLAYAPYDSKYDKKVTKDNQELNFIVSPTIKDQKDLLWAKATNQTMANNSGTDKKVKFQFAHALSRLGYIVKLNNDYSGATFTLTKITLAGSSDGTENAFYTTGTIDLSKTSSTGLWTTSSSDAKQNFDWFSGTQTLAKTDYKNPDANYLFVIPQDFSATATGKLYVIVEYTIKNYNGVAATMTNKVYKKLEKNFEQGKAYTINLSLGLTPIEFDADVTAWKDTDQKDVHWN
ncbi:fimbrillin family protein [Segatella copri]|uniref:Fimbrillin family protein n=1 Tax=Segatella copri TaxID=165179 RepID=A0AA92SZB8_9BACT|nr:fimbrillin family protein [Segatella copri]RGL62415.1 fimbrillin family protein [Segatella copri]